MCIYTEIHTQLTGSLLSLLLFVQFYTVIFIKCQPKGVPGVVVIVTVDTVIGSICKGCSSFLFQSHGLILICAENGCVHVVGLMNSLMRIKLPGITMSAQRYVNIFQSMYYSFFSIFKTI